MARRQRLCHSICCALFSTRKLPPRAPSPIHHNHSFFWFWQTHCIFHGLTMFAMPLIPIVITHAWIFRTCAYWAFAWNIIINHLTRKSRGFMSKTTMHSASVVVSRIYRLTWSAFDTCNKCYAHVTGSDYPFHTHHIVEIKKRFTGEKTAQNIRQKASAFGWGTVYIWR